MMMMMMINTPTGGHNVLSLLRTIITWSCHHHHHHRINQSINQSINLFAHNTTSSEAVQTSGRDEQDSQAPRALMAALTKHTIIVKRVQMSKVKAIKSSSSSSFICPR